MKLTDAMLLIGTGLVEGELAWRLHNGGHTEGPNWPAFLKWADRYLQIRPGD